MSSPERQSRAKALKRLNQDIARCGLVKTRTRALPGEGPLSPRIIMTGEAPGEQEDLQGAAFHLFAGF